MPLLHFTIQQEYRGLSRIGRALTAAYGGAPSVRNYDEKKRALVDSYGARVEQMSRITTEFWHSTIGATSSGVRIYLWTVILPT